MVGSRPQNNEGSEVSHSISFVYDCKIGLYFVDLGGPGGPGGQIVIPTGEVFRAPPAGRSICIAGAAGTTNIDELDANLKKTKTN